MGPVFNGGNEMAVTTTKSMGQKTEPKKEAPKKAEAKPAAHLYFEHPAAPMGKSKIAFFHKGEQVQLELKDKRYEIKSKDPKKIDEQKKMLLANGFVDKSYVDKKPAKKAPKKKYLYTFGHPDNAPDDFINGKYSLTVGGKDLTLEVVDGLVTTEDDEVAKALEKNGFYPNSKEEIE